MASTSSEKSSLKWLPVLSALIILPFVPIWTSKYFAEYLFIIFVYAPSVLIGCVVLAVWGHLEKSSKRRRSIFCSLAVVVFVHPLGIWADNLAHDRVAFLVWRQANREVLDKLTLDDRIIKTWDSWGMAGMENDSYLISNPADTITDTAAATAWIHQFTQGGGARDCEAVNVKRLARGVYLITTFNCPLE